MLPDFSQRLDWERMLTNETKYSKSGLGWLAGPKPYIGLSYQNHDLKIFLSTTDGRAELDVWKAGHI